MDSQKQQAAERIKQANNILVTVSSNPSVDQLAACIGLTLTLNKMGKHATAVFSGSVPSTIEFLQPEKTIEKNTDSLRDFIIALDKSKADKLRYKVEDRVVKIFITPYRTSISEKDLEFSQGDFNVDVVLALGVHNQADLDQAITSHGRILHDATVVTMNVKPGGELGSINWLDPAASSLSELGVQLVDLLDKKLIDTQISTAFLTGIVAETERFSNAKTSPQTMSISAELMAAGANQQLVATKLEEPAPPPPVAPIAAQSENTAPAPETKKPDDGTLEISHDEKAAAEKATQQPVPEEPATETPPKEEKPAPAEEPANAPLPLPDKKTEEPKPEQMPVPQSPKEEKPVAPQIHIDEHGALSPLEDTLPPKAPSEPPSIIRHGEPLKMVLEPPTLGGQLTASATPGLGEANEMGGLPQFDQAPAVAPSMSSPMIPSAASADEEGPSGGAAPSDSFLVGTGEPSAPHADTGSMPAPQPVVVPPTPVNSPAAHLPEKDGQTSDAGRTLSDIEHGVHSSHADQQSGDLNGGLTSPNTGEAMLPPLPSDSAAQVAAPSPTAFDPSNFSLPSDQNDPGASPDISIPDMPVGQSSPASTPISPAPASMSLADAPSDDAEKAPDLDSARDAVAQAINSSPSNDPIEALNAQPVDLPIGSNSTAPSAPSDAWTPPAPVVESGVQSANPAAQFSLPATDLQPDQSANSDPNAPPPVPPPMMPPTNPY